MLLAQNGITRRLVANYLPRIIQSIGIKHMTGTLRTGELIRFTTNSLLRHAILLEERFEASVQAAIAGRVVKGMTVIDIGANIGFYTVKLATMVGPAGQVIAVEPHPAMREQLEYNIRLNGFKNVAIVPLALSDRAGTATFCFPQPGYEAHGSLRANASFQVAYQAKVQTECLDQVLKSLGNPRVHFVKMDVEGGELDVLRGAEQLLSSAQKPTFAFEAAEALCAPYGHRVFDVLQHFASHRYSLSNLEYGNWLAEPE